MSMCRNYINDYGCYIDEDTIYKMCQNKTGEYPDTVYDAIEELEDDGLIAMYEFSGIVKFVSEDDPDDSWEEFYGSNVCYFPLDKIPALTSKSYNSLGEIVSEIKHKYGKSLPEDYNILDNICEITGTIIS